MVKKAGNICAACEVDSLVKMFKRKGGVWFLIGVVAVLILIKFVFMRRDEPDPEEAYMHEEGDLPWPKNQEWKFLWQDHLLVPKVIDETNELADIPQEEFADQGLAQPIRKTICNPRQLLCERRRDPLFDGLHKIDAQELVHRVMTKMTYKCRRVQRFGNTGSGGYEVCLDKSYDFKNNECLVYSFGLSSGYSFEQAVSDQYGCEIHVFDPAVELSSSDVKGNITYHKVGVWGDDFDNTNGWQMRRFASIVKMLGHESRVIDVVKMDGRGAEWPFFRDIAMDPSPLDRVKQFIFDAYAPRRKPRKQIMRMTDYAQVFRSVSLIKRLGFRNFWHHGGDLQQGCCNWWSDLVPPQISGAEYMICCYQVFLVNMNYL